MGLDEWNHKIPQVISAARAFALFIEVDPTAGAVPATQKAVDLLGELGVRSLWFTFNVAALEYLTQFRCEAHVAAPAIQIGTLPTLLDFEAGPALRAEHGFPCHRSCAKRCHSVGNASRAVSMDFTQIARYV